MSIKSNLNVDFHLIFSFMFYYVYKILPARFFHILSLLLYCCIVVCCIIFQGVFLFCFFLAMLVNLSQCHPSLFLIYINDLPDNPASNQNCWQYLSFFLVVKDIDFLASELNNDSAKICDWGVQWSMNFNAGPGVRNIFSRKTQTELP